MKYVLATHIILGAIITVASPVPAPAGLPGRNWKSHLTGAGARIEEAGSSSGVPLTFESARNREELMAVLDAEARKNYAPLRTFEKSEILGVDDTGRKVMGAQIPYGFDADHVASRDYGKDGTVTDQLWPHTHSRVERPGFYHWGQHPIDSEDKPLMKAKSDAWAKKNNERP